MSGGIINPTELIATLINQKTTFEEGIEYAYSKIKGSMSILIMCDGVLYAARDRYGRTPVFIGQSHDTTAVSMEDAAFLNLGLKMVLELERGRSSNSPRNDYRIEAAAKKCRSAPFSGSITVTLFHLRRQKRRSLPLQ
jgi:glutamine phosphoribosylpyrophosphate amidotransferase